MLNEVKQVKPAYIYLGFATKQDGRTRITKKYVISYSSTDNFLSPIPISDWLVCCYGYLIRKRNENDDHNFF